MYVCLLGVTRITVSNLDSIYPQVEDVGSEPPAPQPARDSVPLSGLHECCKSEPFILTQTNQPGFTLCLV